MEAAGKISVDIEAKLSRGPSIPILRRQGASDRRHEVGVNISSGNLVTAKVPKLYPC
jgi:amino-acid N-acetyltransferase